MAEAGNKIASALEDIFTSVYTVKTDNDFEPLQSRITDRSGHSKMLEVEFTVDDIIDKLAKLKLNKSPGLDLLHPRVLHKTVYPLYLIFNKNISSATSPSDWTEVTAIHKKDQNQTEETIDQSV